MKYIPQLRIGAVARVALLATLLFYTLPLNANPVVSKALQYKGVRYRWGGTTTRGMDCSGLVLRVLSTQGIQSPHSAARLAKLGVKVKGELQPGDLLFFRRGRRIGHVGIYIGEQKYIHASSGRHRVTISSLSKYAMARRILQPYRGEHKPSVGQE
jgi:cell wall-associated NlpC family hydrolase